MSRFSFWWRFILALLLIGGLVVSGVILYQSGYAQGYQSARLAAAQVSSPASAEGANPAVVPPYVYPYPGWGLAPFLAPFRMIALCASFLLVLFVLGGLLFGFGAHRRSYWAPGYAGPFHGSWRRGPMPPWAKEWIEQHKDEWEKCAAAWHSQYGATPPWARWSGQAPEGESQAKGESAQPPETSPDAA